jgi:glycosyltransferase involved in cell wall biosynthesis
LTQFSIITVSLNSGATIRDAIESVLVQDYRNIEYIVVDGASQDETTKIVREYADQVSKFLSAPDDNVYDAMNTGIGLASGDIIGFINSDDFYASSDAISSVAAVFENKGVDAVYGDLCYVGRKDVSRVVRYWRSVPFSPGSFARGWCPPHPTFCSEPGRRKSSTGAHVEVRWRSCRHDCGGRASGDVLSIHQFHRRQRNLDGTAVARSQSRDRRPPSSRTGSQNWRLNSCCGRSRPAPLWRS